MTDLIKKIILTAAVLFSGIAPVLAHKDTSFNSPHKLELKPASFAEPGYQLAKSYWLGGADLDLNFKDDDDKTRCNSMGYFQEACQGNKSLLLKCPYNSAYFKCTCDTSAYRYSALNCPPGSYPDEDVCDDYSKGCVCENNKIWLAEDNSCVDCLNDSDCDSDEKCQDSECVNIDLCADVVCSITEQRCNQDTGQCECPSNKPYESGSSCVECTQASHCENGVCTNNGECVECVSASDCGANEICSGNTCQTVDRCKDVSCSGGKSCNPNNGQCECPSDKPYESGSGCVVCTQDSHCKDGKKCNKATNLCEMVKEETCRTQAEAKGWTLITNGTEFIEALNAGKAKLAFVGKVYTSALSLILKADNAILEHATKVVGDLCTEPGSIEFETLQTNATIDINIPGTINHLYAESNSVININGNNFIVNKTSCDKNSTCRLNLQGRDIYLKEIEALSGSKLTVYGNNHNPLLYTNILKDDILYPANVDLITIQSGSSVTLAGGMSIGTIDMNGIDQNIQTSLIFGDGGYFVSRPYKYKKSYNFIEVDDCRNKGCIIHVGRQTGGSVNINMNGRGINYKASSGYNYAGSGSLVFNMMSSVLNNVGTISSSESYSRRYIIFFFDSKGNTSSQFKFANGGFLGINRTYGGSANHFQCQYNFSGSISSASQCPTNTGNCTCSKY